MKTLRLHSRPKTTNKKRKKDGEQSETGQHRTAEPDRSGKTPPQADPVSSLRTPTETVRPRAPGGRGRRPAANPELLHFRGRADSRPCRARTKPQSASCRSAGLGTQNGRGRPRRIRQK